MRGPRGEDEGCGVVKPFEDFYVNASMRDGRGSWCKPCTAASAARSAKSERGRARLREYWRPYRQARAPGPRSFTCRVCGVETTATGRPTQRYCSPACRDKRARR